MAHDRRAPLPGTHVAFALWLTRGSSPTFPVLEIGGRAVGDSSAILAELDRRHPDPPLYPDEPAQRERALALEDHFDEQLGPFSRLAAFNLLRQDRDAIEKFAAGMLPPRLASNDLAAGAMGRVASAFVGLRYGAGSDASAHVARERVAAALDRLEEELERAPGDYLVGDRFSVADLTAAAMFLPVVLPPEGPSLPAMPEPYEEWRKGFSSRPAYRWVEEMFRWHRREARRP